MAYVYRHIRKDKNQPFYIGIGSDSNYKRANESGNRRNKIWNDIVSKSDYVVDIIFDEITWEEACFLEKELIKLYGRRNLETGSLVNLTDGGEGMVGYKMTEEQKAFHRQTLSKHRSKTNEINRNLKLGKKLSKETAFPKLYPYSASSFLKSILFLFKLFKPNIYIGFVF